MLLLLLAQSQLYQVSPPFIGGNGTRTIVVIDITRGCKVGLLVARGVIVIRWMGEIMVKDPVPMEGID